MVYPLKRSWHIITILTLAVQAAVLDRFGDMGGFDDLGAGQVGDGAGHLDDAVMGAHGEAEVLIGLPEQAAGFACERAVFLQVAAAHLGVGEDAQFFKALLLEGAGPLHAAADGG